MLRSATRHFNFARHVPLRQLWSRLDINVRRRVRDHLPQPLPASNRPSTWTRAACPPRPIFAPRRQYLSIDANKVWRFTFVGRAVEVANARIDWAAKDAFPTDQLWRMNLHYMEYLEGVDDADWVTLVEDWIEANPAHVKGSWRDAWNSYALSIRVVVWMQGLAARAGRVPASVLAKIEASLLDQLRFLERNVETDIGGNHLVKNIKAFVWAGAYFAGAEAARWRRLGLSHLRKELSRQILADGVHYERSPSYHAQVFADLLECRHALALDPFDGRLDATLGKMAQVIADLTHPDGGPVQMNDAGLSMAYAPGECLAAYERVSGGCPRRQSRFAYRNGGYFGLSAGATYFLADCGRLAPDELPAHGHGDVLSFEWSVAGRRIVVDQGVFEYVAGRRRQQSRSAASHNTLCIDGSDQADFFGAFRLGRRPNVEVRRYEVTSDGFRLEGAHDGFSHLPGHPRHARTFEVGPSSLSIEDRIEGASPRAWQVGFLLHPEVRVEACGSRVSLARGDARIEVEAEAAIEVEDAIWWPDMGHEVQTRRLVLRRPSNARGLRTTLTVRSGA